MANSNNKDVYLYECPISYKVMYWIAKIEKSQKRDIGYPFLISFNKKGDIRKVPKKFSYIKIDSRTVDCKNKNNCINIVKALLNKKIFNLDLGAYQINYRFHKLKRLGSYFSLKDSYIKACDILEKLIKKYGYSWKTIAKYHSFNYSHQRKYLTLLSKAFDKKNRKGRK